MFRHHGPDRSDRLNRSLAGYLAFIGGYVNAAGFVIIGVFTSHVTGNVGRFANDVSLRQFVAAGAALTMVLAFFVGAFLASMLVESNFFGRPANGYAVALCAEATLLVVFATIASPVEIHPRLRDMQAAILCAAMGTQNSLVTRLSGAVIRTTHLTGVLTDLGIEAARWFRWWRGSLSDRLRFKLAFGRNPPTRPLASKSSLLITIVSFFFLGALLGSFAGVVAGRPSMVVPTIALLAAAAYAFFSGRAGRHDSLPPMPNSRR